MASHSRDHLPRPLFPLWTSCATQKDEFLTSRHHRKLLEATLVLQLEFFQDELEISGWFVVRRSSFAPKKKKPKNLNFIKFSQNGQKESALTEKRAKKNVVVLECWNLVFEIIRHSDIIQSNAYFSAIKVVRTACTVPLLFKHTSYLSVYYSWCLDVF